MAWCPFEIGQKVVVNAMAVHSPYTVGLKEDTIYEISHLETAPIQGDWRVRVLGVDRGFSCDWFKPAPEENPVLQESFEVDCGHGYLAVPYDAVCLNGLYMRSLNTSKCPRYFALLFPNGHAAMGEDGIRPYKYNTIEECKSEAQILFEINS